MTDGLKEAHRTAIGDVLRANGRVERAVLFGSRAKETFTQGSDVDIALFGEALTTADQARLAAAMEELPVPQRVDLLLYDRIEDSVLREHVRRDGIELYRKQENASAGRLIVPEAHRRTLVSLLREHLPGVEVWAYGSRVDGRSHDGSDLDLVLRSPDLVKIDPSQLAEFNQAVQESTVPFLVEARNWARLPESFQREIEREYVVLVGERVECSSSGLEWPTATIEDISEKVAMGPFGSSIKVSTFVLDGVPIISGQHLHGVRVDDSPGFNFISYEHAQRLANANVRRGDVIFTHAGNIGQVAYIPARSEFDRYVISQRQFYMRCKHSKAIPEFIALYFTSPEGQHQLLANSSQVGVPAIARPVTYLRTIEIPLPPLPEQRRIAHILGTLDDKIELNRRMNETLEAMARAIFKDWFVDFGPVRAKAALREAECANNPAPHRGRGRVGGDPSPKDSRLSTLPQGEGDWTAERARAYLDRMDPEIAALFPDRFADSELGEIPAGWEVKTLGDLCRKPQYGYTASAKSEPVGPRFLRITDINKESWVSWSRVPYCETTDGDLLKYRLSKGDVLIARMADPGHGILVEEDAEGVFASYLIRFKPTERHHARLLQYWLKSDVYWQRVKGHATGTTRVSLNARVLSSFPLVVPPNTVADVFAAVVGTLRNRLVKSVAEMESLAALRDALLPKLISGELHVKVAEKFIGRAV